MFVVHRAAEGSVLAEGLADVLRPAPDDAFACEVVAVPAKGVERWLAQRLSHVLGSARVADGVCANVRFPAVTTLVDEVLERVAPPEAIATWRPERLVWPLLDEIDACGATEPWCAPLARHLGSGDGDKGRRLRTASKLARLFDSYAQSRPQMLQAWAAGKDEQGDGRALDDDVAWQAELWRRLRARVAHPSTAELLDEACARIRMDAVDVALPARLSVFGASRLSRARLQVLAALAEHRDVHLWLHHASPALWNTVAAAPPATRRAADTSGPPTQPAADLALPRRARAAAAAVSAGPGRAGPAPPEPPGA